MPLEFTTTPMPFRGSLRPARSGRRPPRHCPRAFLLLAVTVPILTCWLAAAGPAKPGVSLSLADWKLRQLNGTGPHAGRVLRERQATLNLGDQRYAVSYKAAYDESQPERAFPIEGYIGMPSPCSSNWYHGGFLFVILDGQDIGNTPISSVTGAERGARGIVDMVWRHTLGDVRVRFLGGAGRDHLLCEVAVEPKQPLKSIAVKLRCYPSFFTSWHKRVGARRVQTPSSLIVEGKKFTASASTDWWAVYYDEVFDVAKGEGEGPCAMLLLPEEAGDIRFAPGDYAVETLIDYPPDRRRLHLAFWEFRGAANAEALERLQAGADTVRQELAAMDFTPRAAVDFDARAVLAEIERALASEGARALLGDTTQTIRTWIDEHAPVLLKDEAAQSIRTQEELLQSMDKYQEFMWEVKLAELLSNL